MTYNLGKVALSFSNLAIRNLTLSDYHVVFVPCSCREATNICSTRQLFVKRIQLCYGFLVLHLVNSHVDEKEITFTHKFHYFLICSKFIVSLQEAFEI